MKKNALNEKSFKKKLYQTVNMYGWAEETK